MWKAEFCARGNCLILWPTVVATLPTRQVPFGTYTQCHHPDYSKKVPSVMHIASWLSTSISSHRKTCTASLKTLDVPPDSPANTQLIFRHEHWHAVAASLRSFACRMKTHLRRSGLATRPAMLNRALTVARPRAVCRSKMPSALPSTCTRVAASPSALAACRSMAYLIPCRFSTEMVAPRKGALPREKLH